MSNPGGHKRRSSAKMATLGDISAMIEMARLEATETSTKDAQPEAYLRGVEFMRSKVREHFESAYNIKLPEVQAVRRKDSRKVD
jgi:hypothetical protein